jgi:hypothetical protein
VEVEAVEAVEVEAVEEVAEVEVEMANNAIADPTA